MNTNMLTADHDANTLEGGWQNVEDFIDSALLIAFDGCHKVYLAMDQVEADWFRAEYPNIRTGTSTHLLEVLHDWFDESCSLRFINAVYHNEADPNAGFITLISQFAGEEDEDYDEDED
jgi:hypothetical protein